MYLGRKFSGNFWKFTGILVIWEIYGNVLNIFFHFKRFTCNYNHVSKSSSAKSGAVK